MVLQVLPLTFFCMIESTAFLETGLAVSIRKNKVCFKNITDFFLTFAGSWVKMMAYNIIVENECSKIRYSIAFQKYIHQTCLH